MHSLFDHKPATKVLWSEPTSDAEVHARAAGRARYNRDRQFAALVRRNYVVRRFMELHAEYGAKAQIAREFGVARSTVTRDIRNWSGEQMALCPTCLSAVRNDDWDIITEARKHQYVENPLSDAAHARRAAIEAIREELPRVLADLHVFINEPEDEEDDEDDPHHSIFLPRVVLADMVDRVSGGLAAA
jgi:hypothetical protein